MHFVDPSATFQRAAQLAGICASEQILSLTGEPAYFAMPYRQSNLDRSVHAFVLGGSNYFFVYDYSHENGERLSSGTIKVQLDHQRLEALPFENSSDLSAGLVSLNNLTRHIREVQQNIIDAAEDFSGEMMMTTSGGRNAPFLISVVAEMIVNPNVEPEIRQALLKMPIIFLDLQDNPSETYQLLADIREMYPYINMRRFTHALDVDVLDAELKLRIRDPQNNLDPVTAYLDLVKTPLLPEIVKILASEGTNIKAIISGNRKDQTLSRATLATRSEQQLGQISVSKIFPAANVPKETTKLYRTLVALPEHALDPAIFPSIGINLEMDPGGLKRGTGDKTGRTADECRMHFQHQKLSEISVREISDWAEIPQMDSIVLGYLQRQMREHMDSMVQI